MTMDCSKKPWYHWFAEVFWAWYAFFRAGILQLLLIPKRPSAVLYNLLAVVLAGGLGLWITLWLYDTGKARAQDLCLSVLTYSLALVSMSILDVFWRARPIRPIQIQSVCLGIAALYYPAKTALRLFVAPASPDAAPQDPYGGHAVTVAVLSVALPALCWLFVNIDDKRFENDPDAAVGGNPMQGLES